MKDPVQALKSPVQALIQAKRELIFRFTRGEEPEFLRRHSEILDNYFQESFVRSAVGPGLHLEKNPCAFLALGGYGRREQCLASDVDVLLLFDRKIPEGSAQLVQEIFYPLWDAGIEVSYAVRTFKECARLASRDFEALTALADARFLCGISSLYSGLLAEVRDKVLNNRARSFLGWLVDRNRERHARYGDATCLLEPNLKEGIGGLRDYHAMLWLAWAKDHARGVDELEDLGLLSADECRSLVEALSFIWSARNWLHHLSGRKCDQLYFDYQLRLARALRFKDDGGQRAVERFLGTMHGHMEYIKQLHLTYLNKALPKPLRASNRASARALRGGGLRAGPDGLDFESPDDLGQNPVLLMRAFEQAALTGLPLTLEAKRLVRRIVPGAAEELRGSHAVVQSFRRILMAPGRVMDVLSEMFHTGMLTALVPELEGIVNRIQFDNYHLHPVHKHSLATVQVLKDLHRPGPLESLAARLLEEVPDPEPLLWAALFHDVGKGAPGKPDHAVAGAQMVRAALARLHVSDRETEQVSFLVREHLFLIETATRRNIQEEAVVVQSARKFRNADELKMLYLLTVADCKSTGPKAWNDWTAVLLEELFFKIYHILEKGELATPASVDIVKRKRQEVLGKAGQRTRRRTEELFDQMSPRYLLDTSSEDILRHAELYRGLGDAPFILDAKRPPGADYRIVTVCARDRPGLFSKISGVCTLNNLDILNARIYTWTNGTALDLFMVKPPPDPLREAETWDRVRADLNAALEGALVLDEVLAQKLASTRPARERPPAALDRIVVDNDASDFFTIVEVYTHDFPGLLYKLTNALFGCELDVRIAQIATRVDQVVDVFYVRDLLGQKVEGPERVEAVRSALRRQLLRSR
ncbi:MAG: [protein-PII] uridylyltransferase [bacterium]